MTPAKNEAPGPSLPETADIETSSDAYANRFAGAVGSWMLSVQERGALRLLCDREPGQVLDVGGGHGQLAYPLAREGWEVEVLGSAPSCAHRIRPLVEAGSARFTVGNVINLPYPDNRFDAVVCFRLVTHCTAWPTLIRELCRVSRGPVVIDYPTSQSVNAIAPLLFGAKKKLEGDTRTWTLFRHHQLREAFENNGYTRYGTEKQFFLPMVLHRALRSGSASAALEAIPRALGLTALLGSPVIARFDPTS